MRGKKAGYQEQIVVVEVNPIWRRNRIFRVSPRCIRFPYKGEVLEIMIRAGYICSTDGTSHCRANNVDTTVVRTYERWRDADDSDDEHEMSFKVSDKRLMCRADAENCRDEMMCIAWFAGLYSPAVAKRIAKALRRTSFDRPEHQRRELEAMKEMGLV